MENKWLCPICNIDLDDRKSAIDHLQWVHDYPESVKEIEERLAVTVNPLPPKEEDLDLIVEDLT